MRYFRRWITSVYILPRPAVWAHHLITIYDPIVLNKIRSEPYVTRRRPTSPRTRPIKVYNGFIVIVERRESEIRDASSPASRVGKETLYEVRRRKPAMGRCQAGQDLESANLARSWWYVAIKDEGESLAVQGSGRRAALGSGKERGCVSCEEGGGLPL